MLIYWKEPTRKSTDGIKIMLVILLYILDGNLLKLSSPRQSTSTTLKQTATLQHY